MRPLTGHDHESGLRIAAVAALECLEVGDQAGAVDLLLAALESDGPSLSSAKCPLCGIECEWPGRREAHLRSAHLLSVDEVDALLRRPKARPRLRRARRPKAAA